MNDRKLLIQKKANYIKAKNEMQEITAFTVVEFLEIDSIDMLKYREKLKDLTSRRICPSIATIDVKSDVKEIVQWLKKELPFLANEAIWIIPCGDMGLWWAKVKVLDYCDALEQLWNQKHEISIINVDNGSLFRVGIDEDIIEIALAKTD
ncbi:hypothetical protein Curi_c16510 [Gottschalkia acidurici 9a]|uniref:Uncharacterized protein n=1 Tax=Gottschalkia acidurici (strain ATCC 7906 / DSM 604 / BCRC 14475 / CIP 104303 / KCTC 5404 / NCIMB 10678 / 9a) TaxID=1128398 RepID=K0AXX8_GOTA9|nr:hypothetical protein [Gottschalkia acidurici]AFS78658.1 hypothetical protein Curi_c16510 [Gottschalkia acidurici 9a]